MPIGILEPPDPLSEASATKEKPILIGSEAMKLLQHELTRYCDGDVNGRSFLIAGHRGSGKTTIVQSAFEQVRERVNVRLGYGAPGRGGPLRPLMVTLQGPNLLPGESDESKAPPDTRSEPGTEPEPSEMENVLIQITLGLYRSLATECTRAFRARIEEVMRGGYPEGLPVPLSFRARVAKRRARLGTVERGLELAGQLELDLDEYPGKMRRREYWRSCGFLQSGVLFSADPEGSWIQNEYSDQGIRELVALSSACELYRRICGKINRKQEKKDNSERKNQTELPFGSKDSVLLKPLIALLTGGTAGAGALVANWSAPIAAALIGCISALAAAFVLKWSASRSQRRSIIDEDLFVPDLSVATLDRVLPVLITRIRMAGLAPVFVVDELDKVVGLSERITEMVRRLKKFVAENAFFCFLTDRAYFEQMRERTTDSPYSIEYTYFTNQIFVVFKHGDLHEYLDRVLEPPAVERSLGETSEQMEADPDAAEYAIDREVLPYILLYGSQMHSIDLRRQLAACRNVRGEVSLGPGVVRSRPRYRLELMVQVAIELVLDDEDMQAELDREPAFLRLAIDALYYVTRCWATAPKLLDLSTIGEQDFESYLLDRIGCERNEPAANKRAGNSSTTQLALGLFLQNFETSGNGDVMALNQTADEGPRIAAATKRFLMERVRDLAQLLAHPGLLRYKAERKPLRQSVIDALPADALLTAADKNGTIYRWLLYPSGRTVEAGVGADGVPKTPPSPQQWTENRDYVNDFADNLKEVTAQAIDPGTLSSQFGLIPTTPPWSAVKKASIRLETAAATNWAYPEQEADISVLDSFRALIDSSRETIALALFCGEVVGYWSGRELAGLKAIVVGFQFRQLPANKVWVTLEELSRELQRRFGIEAGFHNNFNIYPFENPRQILERLSWARGMLSEKIRPHLVSGFAEHLWTIWYWRFMEGTERIVSPTVEDLVCLATRTGAALYLKHDLKLMHVGDWSKCIYASLANKGSKGTFDVPAWLAKLALARLGFQLSESSQSPFWGFLALSPEEQKLIDEQHVERGEKAFSSALVVTMPGSRAILAGCEPSKRGAAIVLDLKALVKLLEEVKKENGGDEIRNLFGFPLIVFEATDTSNTDREDVNLVREVFGADESDFQQKNPKCRAVFCYPLGDAPRDESDALRIERIKNLDDLFIEAERFNWESKRRQAVPFGPVFARFR